MAIPHEVDKDIMSVWPTEMGHIMSHTSQNAHYRIGNYFYLFIYIFLNTHQKQTNKKLPAISKGIFSFKQIYLKYIYSYPNSNNKPNMFLF